MSIDTSFPLCFFDNYTIDCVDNNCNTVQNESLQMYSDVIAHQNRCFGDPPTEGDVGTCSFLMADFYAFDTARLQGKNVTTTESTASVVSTSVILFLNFLGPILVFLLVMSYRYSEKKNERGYTEEELQLEEETTVVSVSSLLSFHELSYSVKLNKPGIKAAIEANGGTKPTTPGWDQKVLLNNMTGFFTPGSLSAIMGPSGCGKSTLLDVLADRKSGGSTTGRVLVNGRPRDKYFKRITAYVMQFDALFPLLTVRELLMYTAELRLSGLNAQLKRTMVDKVIRDLDLTRVGDSVIGGSGVRGISGGQARRVTVAIEIVTMPSILFLDEPTTGLDAYSSLLLVKTLRKLADSGRTLICTIHQPRPDIFVLFNNLLLMKAGEVAYFGDVQNIQPYFGGLGIDIPAETNPADFVVDLTYAREEAGDDKIGHLVDNFSNSGLGANTLHSALEIEIGTYPGIPATVQKHIEDMNAAREKLGKKKRGSLFSSLDERYEQPLRRQVFTLLLRSYKNTLRNRSYFQTIMLQMFQFLFYGLLYLGLRTNRPDAVIDEGGADAIELKFVQGKRSFLFQVMNTVCLVESVVIATAFLEKRIFLREHASGSYSVLAYHTQWIVRLAVDAIWKGILSSVLCYFFPPLNMNVDAVFFFMVTMMVTSTVGSSLAFFMVSAVPDAEGAANIHNTIIGFMGTYSGFYLPRLLIPIFTLWAYYLSFLKYSFEALELNEFQGCSEFVTEQVLQTDPTLNRWTNLLVLMAYPIIFHLCALLASFVYTRTKSDWASCCGKTSPMDTTNSQGLQRVLTDDKKSVAAELEMA